MDYEEIFTQYGIVKIIGGRYKGRFGYYDDDNGINNKAIVYLGNMLARAQYVYIDYKNITTDYSIKDLEERAEKINRTLWENISDTKRASLLEEKSLIDGELMNRIQNFINTKSGQEKRVFLSHSSKDKSVVIPIALDLEKHGISTWIDAFDILPGESIVQKINKGLSECEFILLFLSKNSVASKWVQKEWETVLWDEINEDKVKIIPIKIDDCEVPKILQSKKYIDFSFDYQKGIIELIRTIKIDRKKCD